MLIFEIQVSNFPKTPKKSISPQIKIFKISFGARMIYFWSLIKFIWDKFSLFGTKKRSLKVKKKLFLVLTSSLEASSGARAHDATLACSASKDFCKDQLTLNDEMENFHPKRKSKPCTFELKSNALLTKLHHPHFQRNSLISELFEK